jgi:Type I phosphodiesterase / nucleotide pyrophosphatase
MSACSGKANGSAKANSACSWVVRARVAVPQPSPSAGGGPAITKVIVIGMDGLDPRIVESLLAAGDLPNLASVRARGGLARIATTYPAQTPVAWSTFATGTNPGGHGVFDFLRRDPRTYLPDSGLNRYEQKNPFQQPRAVNLRRGTPVWDHLSGAGVGSVVLRCPCTYPPDRPRERMLSGMGVPDLRGGFGTPTFYSTAEGVAAREGEDFVRVRADGGTVATQLRTALERLTLGPLLPRPVSTLNPGALSRRSPGAISSTVRRHCFRVITSRRARNRSSASE